MNYTMETEWARPYIERLKQWMTRNRITLRIQDGAGKERTEHWLIHPAATDEEMLKMCVPYFSRCQNCEFSSMAHPLILSENDGWLHLCTKMAIAKGIVTEKEIRKKTKND